MKKTILVLIGISLFMSGCMTRQITLNYTSPLQPPQVAGHPVFLVNEFTDKRPDSKLGVMRNAFGGEVGKVVAKPGQPSVGKWIATSLSGELKRAGCLDASGGAANGAAPQYTIGGELQRAHLDSYMRIEGQINLNLWVKAGNEIVLSQLYTANAGKLNWWGSAREFEMTLNMTLQDLMRQMVPDVVTVLSVPCDPASIHTGSAKIPDVPVVTMLPTEVPVAGVKLAVPVGPVTADVPTQLKKLEELKELGLVTEQEYEDKRKELVGEL